MIDQPCPFVTRDTQKSILCFRELWSLRDLARRLKGEVVQLRAELAEAHTVREVTEKHSFEVRAEIEQLCQERDELAAALQRLNRLVVGWWLQEIAEVE